METRDIFILEPIVGSDLFARIFGGVSLQGVQRQMADLKGNETLNIYINTPGGSADAGTAIYYALRAHSGPKNVFVIGMAGSMGSVVALAGDTVKIGLGAKFFIHNALIPNTGGDAEDLRKTADTLDKYDESILNIYASRTKLNRDELKAMMRADTFLTAQEAVKHGFADAILETEPPKYAQTMAALKESQNTFQNFISPSKQNSDGSNPNNQTKMKEIIAFLKLSEGATEPQIVAAIEGQIKTAQTQAQAEMVKIMAEKGAVAAEHKQAFEALLATNPSAAISLIAFKATEIKTVEQADLTTALQTVAAQNPNAAGGRNWNLDQWRQKDPVGLCQVETKNPKAYANLLEGGIY